MPQQQTTIAEMLESYWLILVCAFVVAFLATPVSRLVALRWKIVDRPDDFLKPHHGPIPYLGGVAIFLGWLSGVGLAWLQFAPASSTILGPTLELKPLIGVVVAAFAVMMLGLFDDLHVASPVIKLVGLVGAVAVLVLAGIGDDTIRSIVRLAGGEVADFSPWLMLVYSVPFTLLLVVGACNATNLIDGLDGLCSGVVVIISAGLLVLAVHCHLWGAWREWDVLRVVVALSLMGAALGFLPFNRHPARVFMGDAGSMLLGLNVAVILLIFAESNALRYLLGSLMVFGLPITDTALAMVRRWRNGRPIMQGDRSHFYDQLVDRGWSVRRVVLVSYLVCVVFAVIGCLAMFIRTRYLIPLYGLVAIVVAIVIVRLGMVSVHSSGELQKPPVSPDRA